MGDDKKQSGSLRSVMDLVRSESGAVLILSTILIPILFGMLALVAEMGRGLVTQIEHQRTADIAALHGANLYANGASIDDALALAKHSAYLNGIPLEDIEASLVQSPLDPDNDAVKVSIQSTSDLVIAPIVGLGNELSIGASAIAELDALGVPCIAALDPAGQGVALEGGTSIDASGCLVGSNVSISVPCGTYVTAKAATYRTTPPSVGCGGLRGPGDSDPRIRRMTITDPLAGEDAVAFVRARMNEVGWLTPPALSGSPPSPNFGYGNTPNVGTCSAVEQPSKYSGHWLVTCPASAQPYEFGTFTMGGGVTVQFNPSGPAGNSYHLSSVTNGGGTQLVFGPGDYTIAGGLVLSGGGSTTSFGAGSFQIGPSASGYAIDVAGGAKLSFASGGDANTFTAVGNIRTSGGSCLTLPAGTTHLVKGNLLASGGVTLGAGLWAFDGYVSSGNNGGGSVSCNGHQVGLVADNATIAVNGNQVPLSGDCMNRAFCITAGYLATRVTAPTTGPSAGLAVVGPQDDLSSYGSLLTGGASDMRVSGAFYFPYGPIQLTGGAGMGGTGGADGCLQLIGKEILLAGGTSAASSCISDLRPIMTVKLVG